MSAVINIEKLKKDRLSDDIIAKLFYHIVFSEKISNEDLELFKWYGVYAKDSLQKSFSLRVPINLGELGLKELKEILKISKEFSNESLNILPCQKKKKKKPTKRKHKKKNKTTKKKRKRKI